MSKTKKIFAVLLAISLIFAFAACTKSNTDSQSDNAAKTLLFALTGHLTQTIQAFMLLYSRDITKMQVLM